MDSKVSEVRLSSWIDLIREANTSDLPKKVWCSEHNITTRKFYYWQKKVRSYFLENATLFQHSVSSRDAKSPILSAQESAAKEEWARFYEIPEPTLLCPDEANDTSPALIPGESLTPSMMIRCGSCQVYVGNNVCADTLSTVLKVIRNA